jgi:hypothetical protein
MLEYIVAFVVMIVVFTAMMLALTFSKYKKRTSGCCSGGHCSTEDNVSGCYEEKVDFVENFSNKK